MRPLRRAKVMALTQVVLGSTSPSSSPVSGVDGGGGGESPLALKAEGLFA
jgi:hypothetical protein